MPHILPGIAKITLLEECVSSTILTQQILHIAYPDSPTRFGINTSNTLDIALIRNFYYPYSINSLHDLSSDHNPVLLNFTLKTQQRNL
ncbi:hypothetical protein TNCV_4963721 [Trichonephila clavipes]|nr:hypothetical protein TNCV_4963721 [Trichonephila clavipes]